ncbi:TIM barrel protein [Antrihabitans sp. YC2-6]|uniref:TIM barrel protein n=1 Tax=Antrihabitans sp. YC2-6 TaxID=2799498 RepID=UPI0018F2B68B|nr:TIM barrel protein [Antrihabitans sp. YC2-6]MBJ8344762.1 TIM barrel protein [Antrihabitans sp. YC2-6]
MRLAGAPISWGVCEVPGWGYQLAPERVLREMAGAGLQAAEFGPEGFLPAEPGELTRTLAQHGLAPVGAFAPVVLHRADHDPEPEVSALLDTFAVTRADVLVLAAATGQDGYDSRPALDADGWKTLLRNLDRLGDLAAARGVRAVLHPHVGTMVEQRDEVFRVLDGSSIGICLDTGHLLIGGTDPLELVEAAPARIGHVHLKDVNTYLAQRVRTGSLTYTEAVRLGMYQPLGAGNVDIAGVVSRLDAAGYDGWYVLEQDTILDAEPVGIGPLADVERSIAYLNSLKVSS